MKWVTWERVGVDRMACAWLIHRHVDPAAEFEFVPEGQLPRATEAEPFDIPGARLSHHGGHCSFHALLREYQLARDPILRRIARIVDEADTVQDVTLEPAAPGLDLICRGIRLASPDDWTALQRGALIYDALYAQLASEMPAAGELASPPTQGGSPPRRADDEWDREALSRWEDEGGTTTLGGGPS